MSAAEFFTLSGLKVPFTLTALLDVLPKLAAAGVAVRVVREPGGLALVVERQARENA